mmetsp:Transcript_69748/g.130244  ORF Transcript_69748/g.130244 Transcript_69748/m.130244 type:complete len:549 (-) Transcript_69748:2-1648(-)
MGGVVCCHAHDYGVLEKIGTVEEVCYKHAPLLPVVKDYCRQHAAAVAIPGETMQREYPPMPLHFSLEEDVRCQRHRRILCFGDSLTAGYHSRGLGFSPYAPYLMDALELDVSCDVWMAGYSGLTAGRLARDLDAVSIKDITGRTGKGLRRILREDGPFDLVLIIVGTNDLGLQRLKREDSPDTQTILNSIVALHAACHEEGVTTVSLSVPPNRAMSIEKEEWQEYRNNWQELNSQLARWSLSDGHRSGVAAHLDTSFMVPYSDGSPLWEEDGLHLSPHGSRQLGEQIAGRIASVLTSEATLQKASETTSSVEHHFGPPLLHQPGLRLLVLGDNLTSGYRAHGRCFTPFAAFMHSALLPSLATDLWVSGLNGHTAKRLLVEGDSQVVIDCAGRTGMGVRQILRAHGPFDLVLLWAGLYDLEHEEEPPEEIADAIVSLHQECHAAGVPTVCMEVPATSRVQKDPYYSSRWQVLNQVLSDWASTEVQGDAQRDARLVTHIPSEDLLPFELNSTCWEYDGFNLSRFGSECLGKKMAEILRPWLLSKVSADSL